MNKKSTYLLLILLALSFVLGVGYAVVNSISLTVTGTVGAASEDLDVYFTGTTSVSDSSKVTAKATAGSLEATISVKNMELNETVTATYHVENNESDVAGYLTQESLTNSNSEYFSVTSSISHNNYVCTNKSDTTTVVLSVTMIKTPVDSADSSTNISLTLKAAPKDPTEAGIQCPVDPV